MLKDQRLDSKVIENIKDAWKVIGELKLGMEKVDMEIRQTQKEKIQMPRLDFNWEKISEDPAAEKSTSTSHLLSVQDTEMSRPVRQERPMVSRVLNDAASVSAAEARAAGHFNIRAPPEDAWVTYRTAQQAQWSQYPTDVCDTGPVVRTAVSYEDKLTLPSSETEGSSSAFAAKVPVSWITLRKGTSTFRTVTPPSEVDYEWKSIPPTPSVSMASVLPSTSNMDLEREVPQPESFPTVLSGTKKQATVIPSCSQRNQDDLEAHLHEPPKMLPLNSGIPSQQGAPSSSAIGNESPPSRMSSEERVVKYRKVAVLPSNVVPGYPGFCDVDDLTLEERKPWLFLGKKKKKQQEAAQKASRETIERYPPKQRMITPRTWRKQAELLRKSKQKTIGIDEEAVALDTNRTVASPDLEDKTDERSSILDESMSHIPDHYSPKKVKLEYDWPTDNSHSPTKKKTNYDKKAAREFMKKQRLRRQEQRKKQIQDKKRAEELKQQNYKALLEKSSKLLKTNLKRNLKTKLADETKEDEATNADSKEPEVKRVLVPPDVSLKLLPRKQSSEKSGILPPNFQDPISNSDFKLIVAEAMQTNIANTLCRLAQASGSTVQSLKATGSMPYRANLSVGVSVESIHTNTRLLSGSSSKVILPLPRSVRSLTSVDGSHDHLHTNSFRSDVSSETTPHSDRNVESSTSNMKLSQKRNDYGVDLCAPVTKGLQYPASSRNHLSAHQSFISNAEPFQTNSKDFTVVTSSRSQLFPVEDSRFNMQTQQTNLHSGGYSKTAKNSSSVHKIPNSTYKPLQEMETDIQSNQTKSQNSVFHRAIPSSRHKPSLHSTNTEESNPFIRNTSATELVENKYPDEASSLEGAPPANPKARICDPDLLLKKMHMVKKSLDEFMDVGSTLKKIVPPSEEIMVAESTCSTEAVFPVKSLRTPLRRKRRKGVKHFDTPIHNHGSTFQNSNVAMSEETYPGIESMSLHIKKLFDTERRHQAATKIQSYYRGHRVRKDICVSQILKSKAVKKKYQFFRDSSSLPSDNGDCGPVEQPLCINDKSTLTDEVFPTRKSSNVNVIRKAETLPEWLQPTIVKPCPYNFMTALKKKVEMMRRDEQLSKQSSAEVVEPTIVETVADEGTRIPGHTVIESLRHSISGRVTSTKVVEPSGANVDDSHNLENPSAFVPLLVIQEVKEDDSLFGPRQVLPVSIEPSSNKLDNHIDEETLRSMLENQVPCCSFKFHDHKPESGIDHNRVRILPTAGNYDTALQQPDSQNKWHVLKPEEFRPYIQGSLTSNETVAQQNNDMKSDSRSLELVAPDIGLVRSSTWTRHRKLRYKKQRTKSRELSHSQKVSDLYSSRSTSEDYERFSHKQRRKSLPKKSTTHKTENERARLMVKEPTDGSRTEEVSAKDKLCKSSSGTSIKVPIEDISVEDNTSKQVKTSTEEIPDVTGSRDIEASKSKSSKEDTSETIKIGERLHPTALHLQFQAELNLMDSVEESRRWLDALENLRAVTLAQQSTSAVASALKTTKELHTRELSALEKKAAEDEKIMVDTFAREREEFERILENVREIELENGKKKELKTPDDTSNASVDVPSTKSSNSKMRDEDDANSRSSKTPTMSIPESIEKVSSSLERSISENIEDISMVPSLISSISEQIFGNALSSIGVSESDKQELSNDNAFNKLESKFPHKQSKENYPPDYTLLTTTFLMYEDQIKDEDLKSHERIALLNLREKTLVDRAKADMAWLEVKKSQLRDKGRENHVPAIKKKQRAVILKLQQDREEIKKLKKLQKIAHEEKKLILLQQQRLIKTQLLAHADNIIHTAEGKKSAENVIPDHKVKNSAGNLLHATKVKKSTPTKNKPPNEDTSDSSKSSMIMSQKDSVVTSKSSKSKGTLLSTASVSEISEHLSKSQLDQCKNSGGNSNSHGGKIYHQKAGVGTSSENSFKSIEMDIAEEISMASSSVPKEVPSSSGVNSDCSKKKSIRTLGEQVLKHMKTLEKEKRHLNEKEKNILLRRQFVEDLLKQEKCLEEEARKLAESENQVFNFVTSSKINSKPSGNSKSLQDRGTSPVQLLEKGNSVGKTESKSKTSIVSENVPSGSDLSYNQSNLSVPEELTPGISQASSGKPSAMVVSSSFSQALENLASESIGSVESPRTEALAPQSSSDIAEELEYAETQIMPTNSKSNSAFKAVVKSKRSGEIILKAPLSPLNPVQHKRRYSSGSDESIIYSQTETPSEQSDLEGRVSALLEQLRKRKMEAEKLRREQKRTQRERLKIKEQSLLKQIQAYDSYIQRTKEELEQELDTSSVSFTKPKIKQPRVAEKSSARKKEDLSKRLSLPSDAIVSLRATEVLKGQQEQNDTSGESVSSVIASQLHSDPIISVVVPVTSSHADSSRYSNKDVYNSLEEHIVEEIPTEVSFSDPDLSTAISLCSDKEVSEKSIEEKSPVSLKSKSPDLSSENTVQSPVRDKEFKSDTSKHDNLEATVSIVQQVVPDNENKGDSSFIEDLNDVSSDINTQLEKSDSQISEDIFEDERLTISSGDVAEDGDELSTERNSDMIKVFFSEKLLKRETSLKEKEIEKDTSLASSGSNEFSELSVLKDQHDISQELVVNERVGVPIREEAESKLDDLKMLRKLELVESITDSLFKGLLKESVSVPLQMKKRSVSSSVQPQTNYTELSKQITATDENQISSRGDFIPRDNEHLSIELVEEGAGDGKETDSVHEKAVHEKAVHEKTVHEKAVHEKDDTDNVTSMILQEYLSDATDEILKIYYQKKADQFKLKVDCDVASITVRERVHEIMAETSLTLNCSREPSRLQDLMVTTYDVLTPSPEDTPNMTPDLGSPNKGIAEGDSEQLEELQTDNENQDKVELGVGLSAGGDSEGADNEGFTQEWFDEDFGLSNTRREAEELRLQQLQIEQEIQQLQQAQEQIPFFYVREIPNKPPPPYTPPGQTSRGSSSSAPGVPRIPISKQDLTRLASEESEIVPSSRGELCALADKATDILFSAIMSGEDLDQVQATADYFDEGEIEGEDEGEETHRSQIIFKNFVFDLSKQVVKDAYGWEADEPCTPWEWPACSRKRKKMAPRSKEMLQETVCREVLVLFGFAPKASKENLVIRWSRKRRDYVDELLMRESHEEEPGWTNYDQDEVTLKNEVTMSIYSALVDDTVKTLVEVMNKRTQRFQQITTAEH